MAKPAGDWQIRPISPDTLDLAALHGRHPERYPALLESTARNRLTGRYSILFAFPEMPLWLDDAGRLWENGAPSLAESFLSALDQRIHDFLTEEPCPLPFCGGMFVFLGYEFLGQIEQIRIPRGPQTLPQAFALSIAGAVVLDHLEGAAWLVATGNQATDRLERMAADIDACHAAPEVLAPIGIQSLREDPEGHFLDGVRRIKEYILDGDIFQANLSRAWSLTLQSPDPLQIYRQLRRHNPAPFAGLFCWKDQYVLSSSPERLLHWDRETLSSRPIAGTRPRLPGCDAALTSELIGHPKERAEHIMLIDLIRNDLGRVCQPGSIEVDELMGIESYSHVHHIVSNVRGQTRAGIRHGQMLAALFPGGTITGCPKVRSMEIIADVEDTPRGPYTGSMGYISRDGQMDMNILIRSMWLNENNLSFRAGAGIVADSDADLELLETRAKARALLRALGLNDAGRPD